MRPGRKSPSTAIATDRARETFLAVLRESCNVSAAARAAQVDRRTPYSWRDADPEFAELWTQAEEEAVDTLEQVAWDRATSTSDRMLEILLKGHRPQKYKDRVETQHTGKDGVSLADEAATAAENVQRRLDALAAAK